MNDLADRVLVGDIGEARLPSGAHRTHAGQRDLGDRAIGAERIGSPTQGVVEQLRIQPVGSSGEGLDVGVALRRPDLGDPNGRDGLTGPLPARDPVAHVPELFDLLQGVAPMSSPGPVGRGEPVAAFP